MPESQIRRKDRQMRTGKQPEADKEGSQARTDEAVQRSRTQALRELKKRFNLLLSAFESRVARSEPDELANFMKELQRPLLAREPSEGELLPVVDALKETVETELDSLSSEMAEIGERQSAELAEVRGEVREISHRLLEALGDLEQRVTRIENSSGFAADEREYTNYLSLRERLTDYPDGGGPSISLQIDPKRWVERLEKRGLFYDRETIAECSEVLRSGKALFLVGPPQTGKSTLAQALAALAMGESMKKSESLNFLVPAERDWRRGDVSCEESFLAGRIVPKLGCFSKALVQCAWGAPSWLIIEEINLCNMEDVLIDLYPILDKGFGQEQTFRSQHLMLDGEYLELQVPRWFRFIATMNDKDDNRFDITTSLAGKVDSVQIMPPGPELEESILRYQLRKVFSRAGNRAERDAVLSGSLEFMHRLRRLSVSDGSPVCALGAGFTIKLMQKWLIGIERNKKNVEKAGDQAIAAAIVPALKGLWGESREVILRELLTAQRFPKSHGLLKEGAQ